eukprot:1481046-Amphidinium_carterae.1
MVLAPPIACVTANEKLATSTGLCANKDVTRSLSTVRVQLKVTLRDKQQGNIESGGNAYTSRQDPT